MMSFLELAELEKQRKERLRREAQMGKSVMSGKPEQAWRPDYERPGGHALEAPMFSPDDLIGMGASKPIIAGAKAISAAPLIAAMSKGVGGSSLAALKAGRPFPLKLGEGDFLKRSKGSLPESVNMQGFHWSPEANLTFTDPMKYGRGIKGAEAGRLEGQADIRPRSFFYDNDVMREAGLGANQYRATLKDVYPEGDPLGFRALAAKKFPQDEAMAANALERMIKDKGYKGYENRGMVSYFEPVGVAPHKQGTAIPEPKAPAYAITDTTEVMQGNRTGHMQAPGPMPIKNYGEAFEGYQDDLMKILEGRNKRLYSAIDPAGEGAVTTGYYKTPAGGVETNPVYAHSLPYSEANEQMVGAISPLNALLYGQNAYGFSGVAPRAAGSGAGLRTSIAGATPDQKAKASAILEGRGILAAPNELGLTTMGFDPMDEGKLVAETTKAFRESGIPRAESILGEGRSGFQELPWGAEGAGTATEAALRPLLQLPDSAVQNLDRTGQFQEASRLLNAADSRFSDRYGIPARQDLLTLRDIVRNGGLSGLLTRVKTQGYAGLPAVGAGGIALDEDERKRWSW